MTDEIPEDWIAHDGGPCPVDKETVVATLMRDRLFCRPVRAGFWAGRIDQWRHRNSPYDIIAYKPEQPQ